MAKKNPKPKAGKGKGRAKKTSTKTDSPVNLESVMDQVAFHDAIPNVLGDEKVKGSGPGSNKAEDEVKDREEENSKRLC